MAASGFTPIQLYYSGTLTNVPLAGNLAYGELAINIADGKLYFKNSSNVVTKIADAATATGSVSGGTAGAVVYQSAPNTSTFLNLGTLGHVITAGASAPVYTNPATLSVASAVTSTTTTNIAGGATNKVVYQSGAGVTAFIDAPTVNGTAILYNAGTNSLYWGLGPATPSATALSGGSAGDLVFQSATSVSAFIADVATGNALISGGVGVAPSYGKIGLTTHVSGTLPIANGGTNTTTVPTAGAVPYGTGTEYAFTTVGSAGQVLQSNGASAPTWVNTSTIGVSTAKVYYMAQF